MIVNYPYDDSSDTLNDILSRCQCFDYTTFNASSFINNFSILHLNIRSAVNKIDELSIWLSKLLSKPDVICLSETWSHGTSPSLRLPGYNVVSVPRACGKGGGVCIFAHDSIRFDVCTTPVYTSFEHSVLSIDNGNEHVLCMVVYRPPSSCVQEFIVEFTMLLDTLWKTYSDSIWFVAGDFNIDLFSANSTIFTDLLLSVNLYNIPSYTYNRIYCYIN